MRTRRYQESSYEHTSQVLIRKTRRKSDTLIRKRADHSRLYFCEFETCQAVLECVTDVNCDPSAVYVCVCVRARLCIVCIDVR